MALPGSADGSTGASPKSCANSRRQCAELEVAVHCDGVVGLRSATK
jgi:hypothetical protein